MGYAKGDRAPPGLYLSVWPPDLRMVSGSETRLRGFEGLHYRRYPIGLVIPVAPVLGGLFAVSFPVLIVALVALAILRWMREQWIHPTGERVQWGVYFEIGRPGLVHVGRDGDRLDGRPGGRHVRLWTPLFYLGAPLFGLVYILFFSSFMIVTLPVRLLMMAFGGRSDEGRAV